jgi:flagellar assembly protein FliH
LKIMSSELFIPASAGPTTVLPGNLEETLPELTTLQERFDHGYEKGFMAGYAEGARQAQAERAADLANHKAAYAAAQARATNLLDRIAAEMNEQLARLRQESADLTDELVEIAFKLAEAVLGAELRTRPERALEAARQALANLPLGPAVIRVHPEDAPLFDADVSSLNATRGGHGVTVIGDPGVERGGCVAAVGATTVDVRVSTGLARAREAFLGCDSEEALGGPGAWGTA